MLAPILPRPIMAIFMGLLSVVAVLGRAWAGSDRSGRLIGGQRVGSSLRSSKDLANECTPSSSSVCATSSMSIAGLARAGR